MACKFIIEWVGECGKETEEGEDYCKKHKGVKCRICKKQAYREGGGTVLGLWAADPRCKECER